VGPEAFAAASIADLFEEAKDRLFRYALSLCKTVDRADDLVQEAFLRALQHRRTLERMNRYQRDAWLKRVVRNRFFDEERSKKRARAAIVEMIRHAKQPAGNENLLAFSEILDRVPAKYRGILEKRYRLGMNSREIGDELGIPAATVRSHLHQGIQWLRSELADAKG